VRSGLLIGLVALLGLGSASVVLAQSTSENAEARVYFQEGNRLYEEAGRAGGAQRTTLLQRSLGAYVDSLRIVRSRNALFNAAIVLGELERNDESFNYWSEYLQVEGLPPADREDATRRRDVLRTKVAVLQVTTEPAGALLWVDRKDLAPRGETPIELALPPGEHRTFIEKEGYRPVEGTQDLAQGETTFVQLQLSPLPVQTTVPEPVPAFEPAPARSSRPRLRNAAIGTAASTLATAGVGLGLSLRARTLRNDYDDAAAQYRMSGDPDDYQRAQDLADRTDRFNLTADVFWGTTIALGVSAIVLYSLHRKKHKREAPEVGVSLSRNGGYASFRMSIGAAP
jgi:hypothetical protein